MAPETTPAERVVTPATAMTIARPVLAALAGWKLVNGEPGALPLMMGMALTDMEGKVAGMVDKVWPGKGYGRTEFGTALDPIADSLAFATVAVAALASPEVSGLGKIAVGVVLAAEGVKAVWASRANARHKRETGQQLVIKPDIKGKWATAMKFTALTGAVLTYDLPPDPKRTALGVAAAGLAMAGAFLGEKARRGYQRRLDSKHHSID